MKSLTKRSEVTPLEGLRKEMDRLFDDMTPFSWWRDMDDNGTRLWAPYCDMTENDDEYIIKVDLPGIPKENVTINYQDNRLSISGERKGEEKEQKENYLRRERHFGSFLRSFTLPYGIKENDIQAKYHDGVLTVKVPKSEKSKPKTVKID